MPFSRSIISLHISPFTHIFFIFPLSFVCFVLPHANQLATASHSADTGLFFCQFVFSRKKYVPPCMGAVQPARHGIFACWGVRQQVTRSYERSKICLLVSPSVLFLFLDIHSHSRSFFLFVYDMHSPWPPYWGERLYIYNRYPLISKLVIEHDAYLVSKLSLTLDSYFAAWSSRLGRVTNNGEVSFVF